MFFAFFLITKEEQSSITEEE